MRVEKKAKKGLEFSNFFCLIYCSLTKIWQYFLACMTRISKNLEDHSFLPWKVTKYIGILKALRSPAAKKLV